MDRIIYKAISDVGLVRTNNEDSFIAESLWDDHHILCAAIDGVGGYEGGEVAAEIARSTIIDFLNSYPDSNLKDAIAQAVLQANNNIYEQRQKGSFPNMSCVVSAAIIDSKEEKVYIAHVGDSRIYLYNKGILSKLTHDHSLVGYREEIGELSEEDAMNHPRRNIIERCLGEKERLFGEDNFIDSSVSDIPCDGKLVFCSDGLTDMVTQAEISKILANNKDTSSKCQMLIDCAKGHGGKDNITVVLVETTTNSISSNEVTLLLNNDTKETESANKNMKVSPENGNNVSSKHKYKYKYKCLFVVIPVITLALGFLSGIWLEKSRESEEMNPELYSWKNICEWINSTEPVSSSSYAIDVDADSVKISQEEYYQLKFYDDNIKRIIEIKKVLDEENIKLSAELAVKDSLLNEIFSNSEIVKATKNSLDTNLQRDE